MDWRVYKWLLLILALTAIAACYRAPELEGSNQVYNPNIEATKLKDNGLAWQSWEAVDSYMDNLVGDPNGPGCAVGVARSGELIYLQGYGRADVGGAKWGVETMGAVGSVSKTFTAAAALRMHEMGVLDAVDDSVGTHLSTGNAALAAAKLSKLLNHASGVGGPTRPEAFSPTWGLSAADCVGQNNAQCQVVNQMLAHPAWAFTQYQENEAVAILADNNPVFGDPHQGVYSNVGYSVAGAIVDKLAQDTPSGGYEAWLWDEIGQYTGNVLSGKNLLSLSLSHSWRADDIPYRAKGYTPAGSGFQELEAWQTTGGLEGWQGPSGGWAMTIGDLTRFAVSLNTGQIVGPDMLNRMRFNWSNLDGFGNLEAYGMGMFVGPNNIAPPQYWHGGVIGGHRAVWAWWDTYPFGQAAGESLAVATICNRDDLLATATATRKHAEDIAFAARHSEPQPKTAAVLPGIGTSRVGGLFELDPSGAWQVQPTGALVPFTALLHTIFLHVDAVGQELVFELSEGVVRNGQFIPVTDPQPLGVASFVGDPWFVSRPANITLATEVGDVEIGDFTIEGAFDNGGTTLTHLALTGIVDTRQADRLAGRGQVDACAELAAAGTDCEPCDDGAKACVTVRYAEFAGAREVAVFTDRFEE